MIEKKHIPNGGESSKRCANLSL